MSGLEVNGRSPGGESPLELVRGKRLGKYRLEKCLGRGGSSEVWKARDGVEGLYVALKIPLASVNGGRDNEALFREIRLVTKLRHRHIMPVKNADVIEGHVVLATELSTRTLYDCTKPMSVRRVLSVMTQVLDGLAYAHRHRVVHCDVSPSNVFLFPNGRAALGDFGISVQMKGRMKTVDDYGTPGYVAPEQAYGRPSFRSDCFAVGLIMYEYITGILPKWPFRWPLRGYKRLYERCSASMVKFMRKALEVDPEKRFADGEEMLNALLQAAPKSVRKALALRADEMRKTDWRLIRRQEFMKRYSKVLGGFVRCVDCGEPIAESMEVCPWCGSDRNRFESGGALGQVCPRCSRGVLPEWPFCPWCFGSGFEAASGVHTAGVRYYAKCRHCGGHLMRFMRYCPWCRRKVRRVWKVQPFPEVCGRCGWSVDATYWTYCPWCSHSLA